MVYIFFAIILLLCVDNPVLGNVDNDDCSGAITLSLGSNFVSNKGANYASTSLNGCIGGFDPVSANSDVW